MEIPFEKESKEKFYQYLDDVFASNFWSEGKKTQEIEEKFSEFTNIPALTVSSGGAGLLAIMEYLDVNGKEVIVPSNTFWATSVAVKKAGGRVVYADCNKEDLCLSFEDMKKRVTPETKAVVVVHIGGHIAFEIETIAQFCKERNIHLVEDCAHAHGATYNGKQAGDWGIAGSYSFYATKTMPLGEGGMVVSHNQDFRVWLRLFRNYGKKVIDGEVNYVIKNGFNFRMNEFTAALGLVQLERLPQIISWKRKLAQKYDEIFDNRIKFPEGMISSFYKYIVFDSLLSEKTGQVFGPKDQGTAIEGLSTLPNSNWVVEHHQCVPIYYGWDKAEWPVEQLKKHLVLDETSK
jgi:perosamine synthetase